MQAGVNYANQGLRRARLYVNESGSISRERKTLTLPSTFFQDFFMNNKKKPQKGVFWSGVVRAEPGVKERGALRAHTRGEGGGGDAHGNPWL